jgi:uncharacterized membrane protein YagU involved in acid resistance
MRRNPALFAILVGGLFAGAFDITYAVVFSAFRGVAPMRILQSVASGLLGAPAYDGGIPTAALGLLLHFLMALLIASIYYLASRRLPLLSRHAVVCGALFGAGVYAVMNLVVLPLSAFTGKPNFTLTGIATGLFVHMFLFGVPIAWATRRALQSR